MVPLFLSLFLILGSYLNGVTAISMLCTFEPKDGDVVDKVNDFLKGNGAKLIRYNVNFPDYTDSVLTKEGGDLFRSHLWIRTVNRQGVNLLMFDDNFEVLSLGLLTIGIHDMDIELVDKPRGCIHGLNATERVSRMRSILLRDFHNTTTNKDAKERGEYEQICNMRVFIPDDQPASGDRGVEFSYSCCRGNGQEDSIACADIQRDKWIVVLNHILGFAIIVFMLYSPKLFSLLIGEEIKDVSTDFTVSLPENSTVKIEKESNDYFINNGCSKLSLDGMAKANTFLSRLSAHDATTAECRITDIRLSVPRASLFAVGCYPVSIFRILYDGIFHCRFATTTTFKPCCMAPVCCKWVTLRMCRCTWLVIFGILAKILLFLTFCLPFIIEFVVYYNYIRPKFDEETVACESFNASCLGHKTGLDLLGIRDLSKRSLAIFVSITFASGLFVEYVLGRLLTKTAVFSTLLIKSQTEYRIFPIITVLVHTILTPFKDYGLLGILIFPIYIPKIIWYVIYSFLVIFPLMKIIFGLLKFILSIAYRQSKGKKRMWRIVIESILYLIVYYVFLGSLMVLIVFGVTFYTEIFFYSLIGVIANSDKTLPFVAMLLPLGVYTRQILGKVSEVYKEFLVLVNQVILSAFVAENGELGQQNFENHERNALFIKSFSTHASTDIIKSLTESQALDKNFHYEGNMLLLFLENATEVTDFTSTNLENVENGESNRKKKFLEMIIPSKEQFEKNISKPYYENGKYYIFTPANLFFEIVDLDLPGSPGPIRTSILKAFVRLLVVIGFLGFVVIAVMGLGATYRITLTDQLMLTVVGGVIPLIFRYGLFNYRMGSVDWNNEELKLNVIKSIEQYSEKWEVTDVTLSPLGGEIASPGDIGVEVDADDVPKETEIPELYKRPPSPEGAVFIPMNEVGQSSATT